MAGTGRISRGAWQRSSRHLGLRQQLGTSLAGAVGTGMDFWMGLRWLRFLLGATNGDLQNGRMLWDIMGPRFEIGWIYRDYGWYSEFMPLFLLFHQHFCFAIVASWTDDCCRVFTFFPDECRWWCWWFLPRVGESWCCFGRWVSGWLLYVVFFSLEKKIEKTSVLPKPYLSTWCRSELVSTGKHGEGYILRTPTIG